MTERWGERAGEKDGERERERCRERERERARERGKRDAAAAVVADRLSSPYSCDRSTLSIGPPETLTGRGSQQREGESQGREKAREGGEGE